MELGSELGSLFKLNKKASDARGGTNSQSGAAKAGDAFETLIVWYLNTILVNTRAIAVKKRKDLVPNTILDATAVLYGNNPTNSESDIIVISFPETFSFPKNQENFLKDLDASLRQRMSEISVCVIQCKTNWNENAQIPMLWDMVYRADFSGEQHITIGENGVSIRDLASFRYAFATVPTNPIDRYKSTHLTSERLSRLSGGNFWGYKSKKGVALSMSEFFNRNLRSAFNSSILDHVEDNAQVMRNLFK